MSALIRKEILDTILSIRFVMATLLCVAIIPLGAYVNLKEYEQRLTDYQRSVKLYKDRSEGKISESFQASAYRPPSVLSIFSVGIEQLIPNKVVTSREGEIYTTNEHPITNPQSSLFGKVDLMFNVSFVLTLLAFIFTFNSISGEKEHGTLRSILSNPVPRSKIFLSKIAAGYIVLLIPFLVSIIIALILLNTWGNVSIFSVDIFPSFLVMLVVTLLFLLSMVLLGLLISALTHTSASSIISLIFVWAILVLFIPKISPMVAEVVHPLKSRQVLELEHSLIRQNIGAELVKQRRELYNKLAAQYGTDPYEGSYKQGADSTAKEANAAYLVGAKALESESEKEINAEIAKIDQEYKNRSEVQSNLATNLSRISPVSCYGYIISEIAATGVLEMKNFERQSEQFQQHVKETLYDRMSENVYNTGWGGTVTGWQYAPGFDPKKAPLPDLAYHHVTLSEALSPEMVDVVLLILFNLIFFAAGHAIFQRYDVR